MEKKTSFFKKNLCLAAITVLILVFMGGCMDIKDKSTVKTSDTSEEPAEYTVIFVPNGGSVISGDLEQTVRTGEDAVPPVVEKNGNKLEWVGDYSNIQKDKTIAANWIPEQYEVKFVPEEGDFGEAVVLTEYQKAAAAPKWERAGYKLSWDQDFSCVTSAMTVHAVWEKEEMDSAQLAEYAEKRTVVVRTDGGSGSGFFIDDQGTFVTNYHVIDMAEEISIEYRNASYAVPKILGFSVKYDLAVLKANLEGNEYFDLCTETKKGEAVYAVGTALGEFSNSFTAGVISNTSYFVGKAECLQSSAAISHGNSGGPLLNTYGEVVGVNAYGMEDDAQINFAIKSALIESLDTSKNYTLSEYIQWWEKERARSYRPTLRSDTNKFKWSIINTFQEVTGYGCFMSLNDLYLSDATDYSEGYDSNLWVYVYNYSSSALDRYEEYIKDYGFEYDHDSSGEYAIGYISTYYSFMEDFYIRILVTNENSEYGGRYIVIQTVC